MSHLAGMSSLWHDAEYRPDRSLHVPNVVPRFADEQELLPSEQHQLPKGFGAFAKMDEVYEAAGLQMDRGLEGQSFLYGKRAAASADAAAIAKDPVRDPQDLTRTLLQTRALDPDRRVDVRAAQESRAIDDQLEKRVQAGTAPTQPSKATGSADGRQNANKAAKTLEMAEGLGVAMAAVAAGQAIDPVGGSLAAEAASLVKAVSTAKTAVGMTKSMDEMPSTSRSEHLRRGLHPQRRPAVEEGEPGDEG